MKKVLFIFLFSALLLISVSAQDKDFNPGDFVLGNWIDSNYDAVWEFTGDNIRILTMDGKGVYYDFKDKTKKDFKISVTDNMPSLSFYCEETGKKYTFKKPLTGKDLLMDIIPPSKKLYTVKMKYK